MSEPYLDGTQKKKPGPLVWLGVGCGVMLFCLVGFVTLVFTLVFGSLRSSAPFQESTARARGDARVIAAIGSPVKVAMFFAGTVNTRNRDGNADLNIGLTGPKGKARLKVVATKSDGVWKYSTMRVEPENGPPIDLLTSSGGSTSTAPPAS